MTKISNPIVFFGSGPVAAKSLELLAQNFTVEAVVTKPTTTEAMAKIVGSSNVYSVGTKAELDDLMSKKPFEAKLAVLIDFGIIVSQSVIDYFPLGIVNSHFSILPELRGADPITFAILSGQNKTGVSLMLLVMAMDEGPLLTQKEINIEPDDTSVTLTDRLISLSDQLLAEHIPKYVNGEINPKAQTGEPTYSRKLTKQDGQIDWSKPAEQIEREIRAYEEWPRSYTNLNGIDVIITKAHTVPSDFGEPGAIQVVKESKSLIVQCGSGYLCIDSIQPAGKKEMPVKAFLAGYKVD